MAGRVYKVHIQKTDGQLYTATPTGQPGWTDKQKAKAEAMRLVGVAGFECKCHHPPDPECQCPCHVVKVIVTEEMAIATYNGPAVKPGKG